mmetsp:Transcript_90396/g.200780  ORF Transcript_90396/g.200780 Transcript_90396/m.200780 type:complete len:202 (+) Transcript_90396:2-607(+)
MYAYMSRSKQPKLSSVGGNGQLPAEGPIALGALCPDLLELACIVLREERLIVSEEGAVHEEMRSTPSLALGHSITEDSRVCEDVDRQERHRLRLREHFHGIEAGLRLRGIGGALHEKHHLVRSNLSVEIITDGLLVGLELLHGLGDEVLVELRRALQGIGGEGSAGREEASKTGRGHCKQWGPAQRRAGKATLHGCCEHRE